MAKNININEEIYCRHCGEKIEDLDDCNTDKYWDNEGNHILYHICPKCMGALEEIYF